MTKILTYGLAAISLLLITACRGGGGGGGEGGSGSAPVVVTKATLKLATSGAGTIYGIDVTINLPAGVTIKSANPPAVDSGVVAPSGVAGSDTIASAVYTAATSTLPGAVRIIVASANGFTTGEFAAVNGDIGAGHAPRAEDFTVASFSASDADGKVITGLTPGLTADIQ